MTPDFKTQLLEALKDPQVQQEIRATVAAADAEELKPLAETLTPMVRQKDARQYFQALATALDAYSKGSP